MTHKPTVVVFGLGDVGFGVVRDLARVPGLRVVACRRSAEAGRGDVNLATAVADVLGQRSDVCFEAVDVSAEAEVRAVLERHEPDLVFQCATALPYWRVRELPDPVSEALLGVGIGWTAPMNVQYPVVVGRALEATGLADTTLFVNASTPDYTNVVLDRIGLPVDCGIGNIGGGRVSMLRRGAAARLDVPPEDVSVRAAFPHAVAATLRESGGTGGLPYFLQVRRRGEDVTDAVDPDDALADGWPELPHLSHPPRGYPLASAHSTAIITGLLHDTGRVTHAPAPDGLPGGWPVRLTRQGAEPVVPPGTDENRLRAVNEAGLRGDGIEAIRDDGTIVFTERSREVVRDALSYDRAELPPGDLAAGRAEIEAALDALD